MKGVLPCLGRWAHRAASIRYYCPALAALFGPVQNIFLSPQTFSLDVPIAKQAGQAVVPRRLSLNICVFGNHSLQGDTGSFGHPGSLLFFNIIHFMSYQLHWKMSHHLLFILFCANSMTGGFTEFSPPVLPSIHMVSKKALDSMLRLYRYVL